METFRNEVQDIINIFGLTMNKQTLLPLNNGVLISIFPEDSGNAYTGKYRKLNCAVAFDEDEIAKTGNWDKFCEFDTEKEFYKALEYLGTASIKELQR